VRRVLLLGKNGQLGWELQRALAPLGDVIGLDRNDGRRSGGLTSELLCGDLSRLAGLATTVRRLRPDIIVNAAAYTDVDKAESEPELARMINALAPGVLASVAAELNACLVQFSSDYVFDGSGDRPWREGDGTGPLGVYGQTKLEGEERIRASGCRHLILRTSRVYAARGSNFAKTILQIAAERDWLEVIDDQVGAPTGAELLADATAHALKGIEVDSRLGGLYHVTASGEASWFSYARYVIEVAREHGWTLQAGPDNVRPIHTGEYPTVARRPLNARLDCSRFQEAFGLHLPPWQQGVQRLVEELKR
jgi:dTDP-4-dehydrorhamnose reductase